MTIVSTNPQRPLVKVIDGSRFDEVGYQRATRINGSFVCPDCGLVWPMYEDVCAWARGPNGKWLATEWDTGRGECEICGVVVFEGFDTDYVFRSRKAGGGDE
jgi:hypothetical protein